MNVYLRCSTVISCLCMTVDFCAALKNVDREQHPGAMAKHLNA